MKSPTLAGAAESSTRFTASWLKLFEGYMLEKERQTKSFS